MNTIEKSIAAGTEALGQALSADAVAKLTRLLSELGRWNRKLNLTAIRDPAGMVSGHVLDSLSLRPFLHGDRILDIGTGAGFPGLPLAVAEPDRRFMLLDSNARKVSFVKHITADLGLTNVGSVCVRAESFVPDQPFDTVVARALATLGRFVELSAHLAAENGVLLAPKGKYPAEELEELKKQPVDWDFRVTELQVPGLPLHSRHVVRLTRPCTA